MHRGRPRLSPRPPPDLVGTGLAGLRGAGRAGTRAAATADAVALHVLEDEVVGALALLEGEVGERDRARAVHDHRGPRVAVVEAHAAAAEGDVVGVVDVPAVRRPGTDALRVVVRGVV